jgi:Na+/H+-dicarboxylate symporter
VSSPREQQQRPRFPLYAQIIAGMVAGLLLGPLLGKQAAPLGEIGRIVVQLIKGVATPLLFFAIVNAILRAEVGGKGALRMLGAAILNASLALAIGLMISNLLQPGRHLRALAVSLNPGPAVNGFAIVASTLSARSPAISPRTS